MRIRRAVAGAGCLVLSSTLCFAASAPTQAEANTQIDEIVLASAQPGFTSTLTISPPSPISLKDARATVAEVDPAGVLSESVDGETLLVTESDAAEQSSPPTSVSIRRPRKIDHLVTGLASFDLNPPLPPGGTNGYRDFHCDVSKSWTDQNGTFGVQRDCGRTGVPWYYNFNPILATATVGPCGERGLNWWVNGGKKKSQQSPHTSVPCDYHFHGTMQASADDYVWVNDVWEFTLINGDPAQLIMGLGLHVLGPAEENP